MILIFTFEIDNWSKLKIIFICAFNYSVDSFENVRTKWYPEVQHHCPDIPVIIVGTKKDLRDAIEQKRSSTEIIQKNRSSTLRKKRLQKSSSMQSVESANGVQSIYEETAKSLVNELYNVVKYVECSAKTGEGVRDVFEEAIRSVINPTVDKDIKQRKCGIFW